ncbi:hypothetical protein BH24ACT26_BH24ACT26_18640 [soil metagenome]
MRAAVVLFCRDLRVHDHPAPGASGLEGAARISSSAMDVREETCPF